MDRRSTKSLWRDYGVPMQDPNAFSLQYYKDTGRDPAKPQKKQPAKKKKVDHTDHTGLLKIQKPKKAQEGTVLNSIYTKYPALKKMGEVTLKADTAFTKDKTGVGDIEYMGPQADRDSVRYDGTGYRYAHPKMGTHGIIYNPNTNDEQSIMLDMLHGMPADSTYNRLRDEFKKNLLNSKFNSDIEGRWEKKNRETNGKNDGKDQYVDTEVDGAIRAMMVEGTPEYFEQHNYYPGAREEYYSDPKVKQSFERVKGYITGKQKTGGLLRKAGYGAKLGLLGMGQYQDKAPQPTKRDAPADKVHNNIKIVKRKKKVEKIAFPH